ncbi:hypothetical protein BD626DRAFT_399535 [Schizophyllum amplum]|uniref:GATA-type domain-containing protein n=1 Tax=Schizophyllum amplum TaxID=97359 RepID=A0A550CKS9_9AGAR|nr:hypothetical protein BD626DRAFT_399535 [Auriculariopsis ampla]
MNGHPLTNGHPSTNGVTSASAPAPASGHTSSLTNGNTIMNGQTRTPPPLAIAIDFLKLATSCRVVLDGTLALQQDFASDAQFHPPREALDHIFAAAQATMYAIRGEDMPTEWQPSSPPVPSRSPTSRSGPALSRPELAPSRSERSEQAPPRSSPAPPPRSVQVSGSPRPAPPTQPNSAPTSSASQTTLVQQGQEGEGQTCLGCDATTTPEWRRGPMGPRTLCNACGLVYAKMIKKRARNDGRDRRGDSDSDDEDLTMEVD